MAKYDIEKYLQNDIKYSVGVLRIRDTTNRSYRESERRIYRACNSGAWTLDDTYSKFTSKKEAINFFYQNKSKLIASFNSQADWTTLCVIEESDSISEIIDYTQDENPSLFEDDEEYKQYLLLRAKYEGI